MKPQYFHITTNNPPFVVNLFLPFLVKSNKILLGMTFSGGFCVEKKLLRRIEGLRKKLNKFSHNSNLVDAQVVEVSQQLDGLLNQYQRMSHYRQLSFW